jgi:hypothetical protein
MKTSKKKLDTRKRRTRAKRPNPLTKKKANSAIFEYLASSTGTLLVTSALAGASLQEKTIIAAFIPFVLKVIRRADPERLKNFVDGATLGVLCEPDPEKEPNGPQLPKQ